MSFVELAIAVVSTSVDGVASTKNEVIVSKLLSFPASSETVIVQSEYVPSLKVLNMMVLCPETAEVVLEEQEPLYVIVPASVDTNV